MSSGLQTARFNDGDCSGPPSLVAEESTLICPLPTTKHDQVQDRLDASLITIKAQRRMIQNYEYTSEVQRSTIARQKQIIEELESNIKNLTSYLDDSRIESKEQRTRFVAVATELHVRKVNVEKRETGCLGIDWVKAYIVQEIGDPGLSDMTLGDMAKVLDRFVRRWQRKPQGILLDPVHKIPYAQARQLVDNMEGQHFQYQGCKELIVHLLDINRELTFADVWKPYNIFNNVKADGNTQLHSSMPSKGPVLHGIVQTALDDGTISSERMKAFLQSQHVRYVPVARPSRRSNYGMTSVRARPYRQHRNGPFGRGDRFGGRGQFGRGGRWQGRGNFDRGGPRQGQGGRFFRRFFGGGRVASDGGREQVGRTVTRGGGWRGRGRGTAPPSPRKRNKKRSFDRR